MRIVTLDFETFFDDDYSLSKLTTEEYVRDPRFEAHGAAVHAQGIGGQMLTAWFSPRELKETLEAWSAPGHEPVAMICHHAHFDGLILSHHFDYRPDFWIDTLSMGRVLFDQSTSLSLESLASHFGLQPKSVPYQEMKGRHWDAMDSALQQRVAAGGCHDAVLTRQLADYMMGAVKHAAVPYPFPQCELAVVDLTVRMFTEPTLVGDIDLLGQAWLAEEQARQELFSRLNVTAAELRQDDRFAKLLEGLGVEPEIKVTSKGNEKYAFARSDWFMQELTSDADPDVARLAEARLKAQSSIYQTRIERYGNMATRGPLCVYLAYAAAHTRRWGGGDKSNFQNLPRPDPSKPQKGAIRRAIKAP